MTEKATIEDRVIELETQMAFQQETIDHLNDMVTRQWDLIENQKKMIKQLDDQLYALEQQSSGGAIQHQVPPHY
ncbi:SlyX family protein [Temperatibacter marinus]|uniref:Protein SlyX homolog n=1 Tax=Temperatibacter marinus TaxID=1456591 RepID=A0AA52EGW8_9PROT|nr:SlyX family protein [Temperatibacter marinus]WND03448.1 SlyX family protein [Temperatibacter marinus]